MLGAENRVHLAPTLPAQVQPPREASPNRNANTDCLENG